MAGGWRIVKTMGSKITRLTPMQGSCAETAGSVMLFTATYLGIPVSTTHTITGSIIGVGAAQKSIGGALEPSPRKSSSPGSSRSRRPACSPRFFYWLSSLMS